jgi:hypothetical protein
MRPVILGVVLPRIELVIGGSHRDRNMIDDLTGS